MTDLKNGILDINGVIITPNTRIEEIEALPEEVVQITTSKRFGGKFFKFTSPVSAGGIDMIVKPDFRSDGKIESLSLSSCNIKTPGVSSPVESTKMVLAASKQWLKAMMDVEPTSECDSSILYSFSWGYITARVMDDLHYGLTGGELRIEYEG